jgi:ATP synthase protein I
MSDPRQPWRERSALMRLAGGGVELAAGLAAFCLLGYWIDRHFGTSPWGLVICALIGIVGGLYNLVRRSLHEVIKGPGDKADKKPPPGRGD